MARPKARLCSSANTRAAIIVGGGVLVYAILNALVAGYGNTRGYPFFPLFVASLLSDFRSCCWSSRSPPVLG